jgi:hypothetical protein
MEARITLSTYVIGFLDEMKDLEIIRAALKQKADFT